MSDFCDIGGLPPSMCDHCRRIDQGRAGQGLFTELPVGYMSLLQATKKEDRDAERSEWIIAEFDSTCAGCREPVFKGVSRLQHIAGLGFVGTCCADL